MEACIRADTAARVMPPRVEGLRVGQDRGRHSWPCCPCLLTLPSIFHPLHPRDQVGASGERRAGVESATALCCGQAHGPSKLRIQITTRQRCVPDPAQTCNIQRSQRPGCCQTAPRQPPCRPAACVACPTNLGPAVSSSVSGGREGTWKPARKCAWLRLVRA